MPIQHARRARAWCALLRPDPHDRYRIGQRFHRPLPRTHIRERVIDPNGLMIAGIQRGTSRRDGKAHIGFFDGTSNLREMMRSDPVGYRAKIYLPTPSAAYPGQPIEVRDDPRYDGGSYLVYRKYLQNLDLLYSD